MLRAVATIPRGHWSPPAADRIVLDSEGRRRRRISMRCAGGLEFLLDLPSAPHLKDGDGLILEDGRVLAVMAASEPLTEVRGSSQCPLIELAYHIGNRHLEAQILSDRILIRRDHVIEDMVRGLGGSILHVVAPFEPAAGAYGGHRHE